jgi:hypothetical protein
MTLPDVRPARIYPKVINRGLFSVCVRREIAAGDHRGLEVS